MVWKLFFQNDLKYFNRIQRGEWLRVFHDAGFELMVENSQYLDIRTKINNKYADLSRDDINCTILRVVHKKPIENEVKSS